MAPPPPRRTVKSTLRTPRCASRSSARSSAHRPRARAPVRRPPDAGGGPAAAAGVCALVDVRARAGHDERRREGAAELAACERAFDVQSSQANAARARCEQLTIDNASLQRRLAAEEERSRSLVRVGQQAAARAARRRRSCCWRGRSSPRAARPAPRRRRRRRRRGRRAGCFPSKSLFHATDLRFCDHLENSAANVAQLLLAARRRGRRRRPRPCSPACGATPRTSSP